MGEKKFAVDIRSPDALRDFYIQVDEVLSLFKIKENGISNEAVAHTVAHTLHGLINTDDTFHFQIINACATMSGIIIQQERKDIYKSIDYIKWSNMEANYRKLIVSAKIAKAFIQFAADVCNGICYPKRKIFFHRPKYKNRETKIKEIYS